jgi:DNA (cytosine-5)-methyltransferase 1
MVDRTVISTFAGCGGSSLGYKLAGFKELLAIEWDNNAVEIFKLNFPDVPVYHGDICKLSSVECMKLAGIKSGELDIFDGSPPCQGFSTAGKREFNDPRNSLFKEYARLLKDLQPKVFVFENVSGMIKGYMKQIYLEIIKTLRDCGYNCKGQVLNDMYFNVPQSRERVIIIGVRKDLGIEPSHPKPQGKPITPREAFKDCPDGEIKSCPEWLIKATKYMDAGNYSGEDTFKAFLKVKGKTSGAMNTKLLSWDRCSCTLVKSEISNTGIIHPDCQRYLTIPEMKRLTSFPDDFIFHGDRKEIVSRIGNSVPPLFMKVVAEHIKDNILDKADLING